MDRLISRAAAVIVVLCSLATPAWGGYKEAAAAYKQGDFTTALRELRPLAAQGHMNAQLLLASCYMFGKGIAKNLVEAEKWMRRAAEQGSPLGQFSLGGMLYHGLGVKVDYPQALAWWRRAAEQQFVKAQYQLGGMYAEGKAIRPDLVLAYMWFDIARENAKRKSYRQRATKKRDLVAKHMSADQIATARKLVRDWQKNHRAKS